MISAWLQLANEYERRAEHSHVDTSYICREVAARIRRLYQIESDYQHAGFEGGPRHELTLFALCMVLRVAAHHHELVQRIRALDLSSCLVDEEVCGD